MPFQGRQLIVEGETWPTEKQEAGLKRQYISCVKAKSITALKVSLWLEPPMVKMTAIMSLQGTVQKLFTR